MHLEFLVDGLVGAEWSVSRRTLSQARESFMSFAGVSVKVGIGVGVSVKVDIEVSFGICTGVNGSS